MGLLERQKRFCERIARGEDTVSAYVAAGYAEGGASAGASRLLGNVEIQNYIQERKDVFAEIAGLDENWILEQYMQIAKADPNDLVTVIAARCCRHCWGVEFAYQWAEDEFTEAVLRKETPNGAGGFGFDAERDANHECPECRGGRPTVVLATTNKLKGPARRLYAGAKQTKDGIEIKMRDQDGALKFLADYKGMLIKRTELSGPGGAAIPIGGMTARDFSEAELTAMLAAASVRVD